MCICIYIYIYIQTIYIYMVCGVGVNSFLPKAAELKSEQKRVHSKAHHSEVASGKAAGLPADQIKAIRVSNAACNQANAR